MEERLPRATEEEPPSLESLRALLATMKAMEERLPQESLTATVELPSLELLTTMEERLPLAASSTPSWLS